MEHVKASVKATFEWDCPKCGARDGVWVNSSYVPDPDEKQECAFCKTKFIVDIPEIIITG